MHALWQAAGAHVYVHQMSLATQHVAAQAAATHVPQGPGSSRQSRELRQLQLKCCPRCDSSACRMPRGMQHCAQKHTRTYHMWLYVTTKHASLAWWPLGPAAVAAAGSCTSLHVVHNTQIDTLCLPKPRTSQPTYFAYVTPGGGAAARTAGSSTHAGTVLDQMHLHCVHLRRHSPAPAPPPPFNLCAHQCNMKEPGCLQHWQR
jgi:hypothetical protein